MEETGILYILATPIGNLSDLSARAGDILGSADLIAAEDTRRTRKLLTHLGIERKTMIRCDEAAEEKATQSILKALEEGQTVVFASDAGVPTISDPGRRLVASVTTAGHKVVPVPGPSAVTTALSCSGFRTTPFLFLGFMARKGKERNRQLASIKEGSVTTVFFESPYRVQKTLNELSKADPSRKACVARELTKLHEEIRRDTLDHLSKTFSEKKARGEFTIVVAPQDKKKKLQ